MAVKSNGVLFLHWRKNNSHFAEQATQLLSVISDPEMDADVIKSAWLDLSILAKEAQRFCAHVHSKARTEVRPGVWHCVKCNKDKDECEFDKHSRTKKPLSWCKMCCNQKRRETRALHRRIGYRPKWYVKRLEKMRLEKMRNENANGQTANAS